MVYAVPTGSGHLADIFLLLITISSIGLKN